MSKYDYEIGRLFARQRGIYGDSLNGSLYSQDSRLTNQKTRHWLDSTMSNSFDSENSDKSKNGEKSENSLKKIILKFADSTSMQGVPNVNSAKHWFPKTLWTVLLLASLGAMTLHLKFLFDTYYSWPKHSTVSLGFSTLEFPAITVCNVNPIRQSQLYLASPELRNIVDFAAPENIARKLEEHKQNQEKELRKRRDTNQELTTPIPVKKIIRLVFGQRKKKKGGSSESSDEGPGKNKESNEKPRKNTETGNGKESKQTVNLVSQIQDFTLNTVSRKALLSFSRSEKTTKVSDNPSTTTTTTTTAKKTSNVLTKPASESLSEAETSSNTDMGLVNTVIKPKPGEIFIPIGGQKTTSTTSATSKQTTQQTTSSTTATTLTTTTKPTVKATTEATEPSTQLTTASTTATTTLTTTTNPTVQATTEPTTQPQTKASTEHQGIHTETTSLRSSVASDGSTEKTTQTPTEDPEAKPGQGQKLEKAASILFKKVKAKNEMKFINELKFDFISQRDLARAELQIQKQADLVLPEESMMSKIISEFQYLFCKEERSTRITMGHQLDDMLVDCSFSGRVCHPQNFSLRGTTGMGNCFTLQHSGLVAHTSGYNNGMQLIVYLEDKEYIRGLTTGSGAQVVIHDRNTCPFPQNDGIAIASGTESNIGLRLVNVIRLGEPHGSCEEGYKFEEEYGYKYTRQSCHVFCLQNLISSRCGCYDEDEEELNIIAKIQQKYPPCRNISDLKCMLGVQADYENGKERCLCDNPCVESRFQYSLSSRQWPSDDYTKVLLAALCMKKTEEECQELKDMDLRRLSQNFIKLNIYYEDLNYENITEEEDYETAQFISDVGGTIGLWIGLSILSMCELVELVVRILHFITFFMLCRSRSSTDKKSPKLPRHHRPELNS